MVEVGKIRYYREKHFGGSFTCRVPTRISIPCLRWLDTLQLMKSEKTSRPSWNNARHLEGKKQTSKWHNKKQKARDMVSLTRQADQGMLITSMIKQFQVFSDWT